MNDNELQFVLKMQDQAYGTLQAFNSSVSGLSGTIQQQIAAMNQLAGALNNHASASQMSASASTAHAAAHKAAAEGAKKEAEAELSLGRALERVANQAKEAAEALVGLWASNEMARSTVEAAEETESAIRKISRASGESLESVKELHEELAKLSMNNGNATIDQLDKMAEAAARMGANKEQMSEFAATIAKISNGGNFQQVTQGIAKVLQTTGEGAEGVEKLGDALAAMEKHSTAGIKGLLPMMERLAGSAGALGISSEHIAAYAATIEKLGGRPEMAVMAFERTLEQLKQTAANGGQALTLLASQAGMAATDFQKLAQAKPEEAFQKVLEVVKQLQDQGKDPANFLSRLGIGDEQSAAIEQMAKHLKELKANLNLADNSGGEADKMAEQLKTEFTRALNEMTTAWTEFKATVGDDVMVAATAGFHAAAAAINALTGFLQALTPEMRGFIEAVVIGTPAVLGLTKIIGAALEAASGAFETLSRLGVSIVGEAEKTTKGVNEAEEAMVPGARPIGALWRAASAPQQPP